MIDRNDIKVGPGRHLFIYYLKGRLKAENQTFQENFIGNWEEENEFIASPADLVIASIHYDVMRHLVDTAGFLEKKRFILSGLLRSEAKDIAGRLSRHGVEM